MTNVTALSDIRRSSDILGYFEATNEKLMKTVSFSNFAIAECHIICIGSRGMEFKHIYTSLTSIKVKLDFLNSFIKVAETRYDRHLSQKITSMTRNINVILKITSRASQRQFYNYVDFYLYFSTGTLHTDIQMTLFYVKKKKLYWSVSNSNFQSKTRAQHIQSQ